MITTNRGLKFEDRKAAIDYAAAIHDQYQFVAGIDETGRGGLAGEVVVGCVILPKEHGIIGIKDSKKTSVKKRNSLYDEISEVALGVGVGTAEPEEIDEYNIHQATLIASSRAIKNCLEECAIDYILSDGGLELDRVSCIPYNSIIKGDLYVECISAASIIAKVYRDAKMCAYHYLWPEYNFRQNSGYGTAEHRWAINKYGITPIHRRSFGICKTAKERENNEQEFGRTSKGD